MPTSLRANDFRLRVRRLEDDDLTLFDEETFQDAGRYRSLKAALDAGRQYLHSEVPKYSRVVMVISDGVATFYRLHD